MGCEAETEAAILVGGGASRTRGAGGKVPAGAARMNKPGGRVVLGYVSGRSSA